TRRDAARRTSARRADRRAASATPYAPVAPSAGAPRTAIDVIASHTSRTVEHSTNVNRAGSARWSMRRTRPFRHSTVGGMACLLVALAAGRDTRPADARRSCELTPASGLRSPPLPNPLSRLASVPVVVGLERPLLRDAEVGRLLLRERRQLHAELPEVQPRDLLVEVLGQRVHLALVEVGVGEQLDLRDHLVAEAV